MKNILFTLCLLLSASVGYSQVKVFSDGDTKIGSTGIDPTPGSKLDVAGKLTLSNASARFISGADDIQQITMSNNTAITSSRAFFIMKGNTGNPNTTGELVVGAGNRINFRSNVGTTNAGTNQMYLQSNGDFEVLNGGAFKTGGGMWSSFSDKRLKNSIRDYSKGLNELMDVRPVTFKYNEKVDKMGNNNTYVGIIAQELQEVAPEMVKPHNVYVDDEGTIAEEYLSVNANDFIYMLINATQEQQASIELLKEEIDNLKDIIIENGGNQSVVLQGKGDAFLGQNHPNPYTSFTTIEYELPQSATSGKVQFFNMSGQLIKTVDVSDKVGSIQVSAEELPSGTYSYSLLIDNTRVATKKMIYTK